MEGRITYRKLLKNRDFCFLWLGQTLSVIGDSLYQVAFFWLAYQMTDSALQAGMVIILASLPYLLFGLIGGVYADRINRRKLMIYSDVYRVIAVLIVPIAAFYDANNMVFLGGTAFVLMSIRCFFYPALKASIVDLVGEKEFGAGMAMIQMSFQVSRILGMAAGGILIATLTAPNVYLIPTVTYLLSVACLIAIQTLRKAKPKDNDAHLLSELKECITFVLPRKSLFWSIVLFGVGLAIIAGVDRLALPILSDREWGIGPEGLGFILSVFCIGNICASFIIGRLTLSNFTRWIFIGWGLWGIMYVGLGLSPHLALALLFSFLAGASEALIDLPMVSLIQKSAPSNMLGRLFSMWSTVAFLGESFSAIICGFLIDSIGTVSTYGVLGSSLVILALAGLVLTSNASSEMVAKNDG